MREYSDGVCMVAGVLPEPRDYEGILASYRMYQQRLHHDYYGMIENISLTDGFSLEIYYKDKTGRKKWVRDFGMDGELYVQHCKAMRHILAEDP